MNGFVKSLGEIPKPVLGHQIGKEFLATIGCPENASEVVFTIGAAGSLKCSALVWEKVDGFPTQQQVRREWEVVLKTTDAFYQLLTGKIK